MGRDLHKECMPSCLQEISLWKWWQRERRQVSENRTGRKIRREQQEWLVVFEGPVLQRKSRSDALCCEIKRVDLIQWCWFGLQQSRIRLGGKDKLEIQRERGVESERQMRASGQRNRDGRRQQDIQWPHRTRAALHVFLILLMHEKREMKPSLGAKLNIHLLESQTRARWTQRMVLGSNFQFCHTNAFPKIKMFPTLSRRGS